MKEFKALLFIYWFIWLWILECLHVFLWWKPCDLNILSFLFSWHPFLFILILPIFIWWYHYLPFRFLFSMSTLHLGKCSSHLILCTTWRISICQASYSYQCVLWLVSHIFFIDFLCLIESSVLYHVASFYSVYVITSLSCYSLFPPFWLWEALFVLSHYLSPDLLVKLWIYYWFILGFLHRLVFGGFFLLLVKFYLLIVFEILMAYLVSYSRRLPTQWLSLYLGLLFLLFFQKCLFSLNFAHSSVHLMRFTSLS